MSKIIRKGNFYKIAFNEQYIAALGRGVTILKRDTFEFVHHFTGMRYIHGGLFLNEDVLCVFTGVQQLFFFQISERKLLWACPKHRQLAESGDMRWCQIPGTEKVACVARGKHRLEEHFLLVADYQEQTVKIQEIPDCFRVVHCLTWDKALGMTLLTSQQYEDGISTGKIIQIEKNDKLITLYQWKSQYSPTACTSRHMFHYDIHFPKANILMCELQFSDQLQQFEWSSPLPLPVPPTKMGKNWWSGEEEVCTMFISWIDEDSGLLTAYDKDHICVCDFRNCKMVAEYDIDDTVFCGIVLDGNLLIGTSYGLVLERLNLE